MRRRDCMIVAFVAAVSLTFLHIFSSWLLDAANPIGARTSLHLFNTDRSRHSTELQRQQQQPPADGASSLNPAIWTGAASAHCVSCSAPPGVVATADDAKQLRPTCRLLVAFEYEAARLGNKLFQYASTVGVARRHGLPVLVVTDTPTKRQYYELMRSMFQLTTPSTVDGSLLRSVSWLGEPGFAMYDARADDEGFTAPDRCHGDLAFSGYVQSWKYFRSDAEAAAVRHEYRLTPQLAERADAFLRAAAADRLPKRREATTAESTVLAADAAAAETWFVGVHVRRGDMSFTSGRYAVAPESYLLAAMRHFEAKLGGGGNRSSPTIVYAVATDEPAWVERALAGAPDLAARVAFSRGTPETDLAVLSRCNHSIVTSGSYGWWAGWLTGGDVVYFSGYIPATSDVAREFSAADYYPPGWVGMSG